MSCATSIGSVPVMMIAVEGDMGNIFTANDNFAVARLLVAVSVDTYQYYHLYLVSNEF